MNIVDLLLAAILSGAAGVGFAVLVQTSPLGRIPRKPFSCRTCLSGWGSIGVSWFLLGVSGVWFVERPACFVFSWFLLSLAGTGIAHVLFNIAGGGAPAAPLLPPLDVREADALSIRVVGNLEDSSQ